jgi:hypothetical protein
MTWHEQEGLAQPQKQQDLPLVILLPQHQLYPPSLMVVAGMSASTTWTAHSVTVGPLWTARLPPSRSTSMCT